MCLDRCHSHHGDAKVGPAGHRRGSVRETGEKQNLHLPGNIEWYPMKSRDPSTDLRHGVVQDFLSHAPIEVMETADIGEPLLSELYAKVSEAVAPECLTVCIPCRLGNR